MDSILITSRHNEQVKQVKRLQQKKYRDQENLFCLEGVRVVEEALPTGLVQKVLFTERLFASPRGAALLEQIQHLGIPHLECTVDVFSQLVDTVSSQGIIAVASKPIWPAVSFRGTVLIADKIQDPGNMGTLIRTAVAAGVAGLVVVEGSVDLYNPKVIRSTAGAIFHLPNWVFSRGHTLELLKRSGSALVVADLHQSEDFWAVAYPPDLAVVIGNEARGVHESFREQADLRVKIPLAGPVDSLNASAASAVLLYEILRQRRCTNTDSVV